MLTGRSCESLFNKITVTDSMSCEERSIHQFLDMQAINQLNVRQYLDSLRQIESPDVKKQLSQQPVRLNLQQRRELMFGQAQQQSESNIHNASPFSRGPYGGDSSPRISRHSVKGDRSRLQLLKQQTVGAREGGKTFRSSAAVHDGDLCSFTDQLQRGGNESSRRMQMLADKLDQETEGPLTAGASPDHHSESKLLSDVEMQTETSPQDVVDSAAKRQPRSLFTRPQFAIHLLQSPAQPQTMCSPVEKPKQSLNVVTQVTPLKKLQDIMNGPGFGSEDYNQISPCIKQVNQQSDKKQMSSFSIKKSLVPVSMDISLQKSASHGNGRHPGRDIMDVKLPKFWDTEEQLEPLRGRTNPLSGLRMEHISKSKVIEKNSNPQAPPPGYINTFFEDMQGDIEMENCEQGEGSAGFSPGTELQAFEDEPTQMQKFNSFQDASLVQFRSQIGVLSDKNGDEMISNYKDFLMRKTQTSISNTGNISARRNFPQPQPLQKMKQRLSINTEEGTRESTNNQNTGMLAAQAVTPSFELATAEFNRARKLSFEGQDTPMPIQMNVIDDATGSKKTILTNKLTRGQPIRQNQDPFQYIKDYAPNIDISQ